MNKPAISDDIAPSKSTGIVVYVVCFLVAALEGYDLQVIGVAAPQVRAELGISAAHAGWVFSASLIGLALGAVTGGWAADRLGRKPVLVASVILFGLFTLASAFATTASMLLAARFATGIGIGGAMPILISLVSMYSPKRYTTTMIATMFWGMPIGGICVAMLARTDWASNNWKLLFYVGGLLPLLVAVAVVLVIPKSKPKALSNSATESWREVFGRGFRLQTFLLWLVFALTLMQLSMMLNWLPSMLIAKGLEPARAFLGPLMFNVGSILGALVLGLLCDRIGARKTMCTVYVLMAGMMLLMSQTNNYSELLALSFILGFLILGAQFALYGWVPSLYSETSRGTGVGAAVAAGRAGAILGPIIAGSLIGRGASGDDVLQQLTPAVLLACVAMYVLTGVSSKIRAAINGSE